MADGNSMAEIKNIERVLVSFWGPNNSDASDEKLYSSIENMAGLKDIQLTPDQIRLIFRNVRKELNLQIDNGGTLI